MAVAASSQLISTVLPGLDLSAFGLDGARLRVGNVELAPSEHGVFVDGRRLQLAPREFGLLLALMLSAGHTVARERLHELVWGAPPPDARDRGVDVHVYRIRRRLEAAAPGWRYVHTHTGVGYRFDPERAAGARPREASA